MRFPLYEPLVAALMALVAVAAWGLAFLLWGHR